MNRCGATLGTCGLLGLLAFSACGVDDRALVFQYSKLANGGSPTPAGDDDAGDTSAAANGGNGSQGAAGGASGGALGSGGNSADAGAASEHGGETANAGRGGTTNAGGVAGSATGGNATSGSATGGGVGNAGSAGNGGAAVSFPCGDLNQDSVDDCAQTLVQNSRFDAAVNGWDTEPSTNQVWDASNATGQPGSGSVKVSNIATMIQAVGSLAAGSHQCVPVTPTTNYDFAARVMLAAGETSGQAGVNVWLFDDDACQGNLVTGNMPIIGGVAGSWTVLTGRVWVPGGVHSMWVRLVAIKPFAQPSLSVLIDDVLVAKR
ncbi:MAG TPA: hypothetical protein VHM25_05750 [Polyangiaceae bacterium]|jgi:hypothetical protein|nr:hypothetical protein [Polyangiaceae bacterium]